MATVVGTAELPEGRLFEFGDVDGAKEKAKLQHCIGVTFVKGKIYVADTYNNKIREVDAKSGAVKTLAGKGRKSPGSSDKEGTLHEPAGLTHAKGKLYVAAPASAPLHHQDQPGVLRAQGAADGGDPRRGGAGGGGRGRRGVAASAARRRR